MDLCIELEAETGFSNRFACNEQIVRPLSQKFVFWTDIDTIRLEASRGLSWFFWNLFFQWSECGYSLHLPSSYLLCLDFHVLCISAGLSGLFRERVCRSLGSREKTGASFTRWWNRFSANLCQDTKKEVAKLITINNLFYQSIPTLYRNITTSLHFQCRLKLARIEGIHQRIRFDRDFSDSIVTFMATFPSPICQSERRTAS